MNPLNWLGGDRSEPIAVRAGTAASPVVQQVLSLDVANTPPGLIVSAIGLPPTQGFWNAELVRVPSAEAGLYLMEFRLLPPPDRRPVGAQPSREVLAGTFLTQQDLAGVDRIAVQGVINRRVISRR
ncbi:hypothetical protein [Jannaschia sp. LMIT008]|uniref:hypothetical protein n=1 Tax=Jannaschia maritima TaxID=3032585 RepID=UPI0028122D9E|nr:hypothetical protein [Jannaschia sp. LMIT008]